MIPKLIDEKLASAGARRLFDYGEANAARDFVGDFDVGRERVWKRFSAPNQEKERQESLAFDVKVIKGKPSDILRLSDLQFALVRKNSPLVKTEGEKYTMKRHLEIMSSLPTSKPGLSIAGVEVNIFHLNDLRCDV